MKNILLIGSGGREHAIAKKLAESPLLGKLFIAPGNPGTAEIGQNVDLKDTQITELVDFAKSNQIDLTIIGPETPLVLGIVDEFENAGLKIVGPSKKAAQLEGSKKWTKALMKKYTIPSSYFEDFTEYDAALAYVKKRNTYPIVIKADGLAAGKGVTIASSFEEAQIALENCLIKHHFDEAGALVVIEDFLLGEEASILAFSDGKTVIPMLPAQDHKAIFDGDKGPNTGGMGTYCPAPVATPDVQKKVYDEILVPLVAAMNAEGCPFKGIIFAGLMIHNGVPSVVEFNARFGDPETQVVLALLESDLLEIFFAIESETLSSINLKWKDQAAVCVVLAAKGYPGSYEKGKEITGIDRVDPASTSVIQAGTLRTADQKLVSNGGRVLGVVGTGTTIPEAIETTYKGVNQVHFENNYFRRDIGQKALR